MDYYKFKPSLKIFKTQNNRTYTNQELIVFTENSSICDPYYEIAFANATNWYLDPSFKKHQDENFVKSAVYLLYNTKNENKLNLVNKILNDCLIFDIEPEFNHKENQLLWGSYHINQEKLDNVYREAINYSAKKTKGVLDFCVKKPDVNDNKDIEILLNEN